MLQLRVHPQLGSHAQALSSLAFHYNYLRGVPLLLRLHQHLQRLHLRHLDELLAFRAAQQKPEPRHRKRRENDVHHRIPAHQHRFATARPAGPPPICLPLHQSSLVSSRALDAGCDRQLHPCKLTPLYTSF